MPATTFAAVQIYGMLVMPLPKPSASRGIGILNSQRMRWETRDKLDVVQYQGFGQESFCSATSPRRPRSCCGGHRQGFTLQLMAAACEWCLESLTNNDATGPCGQRVIGKRTAEGPPPAPKTSGSQK